MSLFSMIDGGILFELLVCASGVGVYEVPL